MKAVIKYGTMNANRKQFTNAFARRLQRNELRKLESFITSWQIRNSFSPVHRPFVVCAAILSLASFHLVTTYARPLSVHSRNLCQNFRHFMHIIFSFSISDAAAAATTVANKCVHTDSLLPTPNNKCAHLDIIVYHFYVGPKRLCAALLRVNIQHAKEFIWRK